MNLLDDNSAQIAKFFTCINTRASSKGAREPCGSDFSRNSAQGSSQFYG